jgi:hypothetical protein
VRVLSVILLLTLALSSCKFFKKKNSVDADVIARVNDEYLYASDLTPLTRGLTGADSAMALKNYAESWVRKRMLLQKANENISDDDAGITKKVEDYRETLLLYEYEKALINQKLDTSFSQDQLNQWYDKMKADFPLQNDVYLVYYIKLKKDATDLAQARKWILNPKNEEDLQKLDGYCKEFATSYSLAEGLWYEKDKALKNFPVSEYDLQLLANGKQFKEYKTDDGNWYIKIVEVLKKDEPSPLDFIKDKIERAIIEKRKMDLIEKVYNKIYQDGMASKEFEIYVK